LNEVLTVSYTSNINAGTANASATYAGGANHTGSTNNKNFTIDKATPTATLAVTNLPQTYDGAAKAATVGVTVSSTPGGVANIMTGGVATQTNAGTYAVTANFVPTDTANYNTVLALAAGNFVIDKAASTTVVTCPSNVTYTGSPLTPCTAVVTGVGGLNQSVTVSHTNNTNAGTANGSATFAGGANHNGSNDSKNFTIDKAASVTTVTCPANVTYSGLAQTPCTAAATGAGGLNEVLTVSYTSNINAGTANASATYAGGANHTGSTNNKNFTINKANATLLVSGYSGIYDALPHGATLVSIVGVGGQSSGTVGTVNLGSSFTNVPGGMTIWSLTPTGNYNGASGTAAIVIDPKPLTVEITAPTSGALFSTGSINFKATVFGLVTGQSIGYTWTFDGVQPSAGTSTGSSIDQPKTLSTGVYQLEVKVNSILANQNYTMASANTIVTGTGTDPAYIVVYDPNGGFVTGGGWITSPAAPLLYMSVSGKANFGFVSKYQKGANVPTGDTEFQFKAGNMNFKSNVYEWLVVAGARAQYKGSGTINGAGNYGFLLTAIDGAINGGGGIDQFRIKITDKTTNAVVYDNQNEAIEDSSSATALGGGSIVIHTSNK